MDWSMLEIHGNHSCQANQLSTNGDAKSSNISISPNNLKISTVFIQIFPSRPWMRHRQRPDFTMFVIYTYNRVEKFCNPQEGQLEGKFKVRPDLMVTCCVMIGYCMLFQNGYWRQQNKMVPLNHTRFLHQNHSNFLANVCN